jgi:hypothetical protein
MAHLDKITIQLEGNTGFNMGVKDMQMNELSILVGTNGSGKSFVLRQTFILGFIGLTYHNSILAGTPLDVTELANFVIPRTFIDPDFTGLVEGQFTNDAFIEYRMDKGVVIECHIANVDKDTKPFPGIKFLSAEMRTFDDISSYLRMRKRIVPSMEKQLNELQFKELCDEFKIYDVMQIEGMINACPITYSDSIDFSAYNIQDPPKTIDVDLEKCDFFIEEEGDVLRDPGPGATVGKRRYTRTYSKGEQSLFNMFAANSY